MDPQRILIALFFLNIAKFLEGISSCAMLPNHPTQRSVKLRQTMIIEVFKLAMWSVITLISPFIILMLLGVVLETFSEPRTYYGPCEPVPFDGCE